MHRNPHILVIEQASCTACGQFRKTIADHYHGLIPMVFRTRSDSNQDTRGMQPETMPQILFVTDDQPVFRHHGPLDRDAFYRLLGKFQLGDSEAFDVAFNHGTEAPFCRQYDRFTNTPDGVFVDILSGHPLFDTRTRFNSGSGWLSFTAAIAGAVTEHSDLSHGMRRMEVRSASSGIHLGHVFDDGPAGRLRYCINAIVLRFKATHQP